MRFSPKSAHRPGSLALSLAALALVSLAPARPASAQTIVNAGFETPIVSGGNFTYNPSGPGVGWTFSGNSGISGNGSAFNVGNPNAPEGVQVGFVQGIGFFSQAVSGFAAGTYAFSFDAAQRHSGGGGQTNGYPTDLQNFQVSVDGTALYGAAGLTPTPIVGGVLGGYQLYTTGPITLSAGTHTLTFQGLNTAYLTAGRTGNVGFGVSDNTAFIDAVAVSIAAPVPEASTTVSLGLLALGLGGMMVAGRRRKA